jgi:6-oxocyclohex-1-ene-carbonyl-CoA hydrolase
MILRSLLLMLQATQGDGLAFDPFSLQQDCLAASVDLSMLDEKVVALCTKLLYTFPDCTTKTVEELRKPKLDAWNRNKENSRAWLALNMMTEARAGFRAFNEGTKETGREAEFIALRRALAANAPWTDELTESIQPGAGRK